MMTTKITNNNYTHTQTHTHTHTHANYCTHKEILWVSWLVIDMIDVVAGPYTTITLDWEAREGYPLQRTWKIYTFICIYMYIQNTYILQGFGCKGKIHVNM